MVFELAYLIRVARRVYLGYEIAYVIAQDDNINYQYKYHEHSGHSHYRVNVSISNSAKGADNKISSLQIIKLVFSFRMKGFVIQGSVQC